MPTIGAPELLLLGFVCALPIAGIAALVVAVVLIRKRRRSDQREDCDCSPDSAESYAGRGPRDGLATSAAITASRSGAILAQTRHRSVAVARRYIRVGSLSKRNAAATVGL